MTPFFNLVLVYNPGAAFSFLAGAGGWQRGFFIAIALVAIGRDRAGCCARHAARAAVLRWRSR